MLPSADPGIGRLRPLFEAAGARWLDVPVLHPADPFLETAGEDVRRRMFVTEGRTGERLALRPDFTIPVCLEHMRSGAGPRRYAYEGVVFRRHDGGATERLETGYEDIGAGDRIAADAAALALAVSGVAALDAGTIEARIGDIGLFSALLASLGLPEPWRRRLRRSFGVVAMIEANLARLSAPRGDNGGGVDPRIAALAAAHDRDGLVAHLDALRIAHGFTEAGGRTPAEIAGRYLDQQALAETHLAGPPLAALRAFLALSAPLPEAASALSAFAAEHGVDFGEALVAFAARAAAIAAAAPGAGISFAGGFGRPLDYYTGMVFEVRAERFPHPVAGGGRYDRLMEMLGSPAPVPAVGFSIRLDDAGAAR